jgi:hypothetical protein
VTNLTYKLLPILLIYSSVSCSGNEIPWSPYGRFTEKEIKESSGFVKSRQFKNVFWTHNDSGDKARIFATTAKGRLIKQIRIPEAKNVDWEDIAVDDSGYLYIGDFGNNSNKRKDLTIYVVEEPNPYQDSYAKVIKRVPFRFPDQTKFPDPNNMNFDSEATFWAQGNLYILTKHRSDLKTTLYRFGPLENNKAQTVTKIGEFDVDGTVTAADASSDGKKLLVLCYEYLYLFEKPEDSDNYLAGKFKRILLEGRSNEGVSFEGDNVLFTNEQSEIYKLPLSYFDDHTSYLPPLPKISVPKLQSFKLDGFSNEWTTKRNNTLKLNRSTLTNSNHEYCDSPSVQIGWKDDGLLVLISNWVLPKSETKPQLLMTIMLGLSHKRTVHLEEEALVWDMIRLGENIYFKQSYPNTSGQEEIPVFASTKNQNKQTIEIFIPTKKTKLLGMNSGHNRSLFNLILNPNTPCEWYWASDSSMYSRLNPYIWGELILLGEAN